MIRTSNIRCREYVKQRIPFKANNLFAENHGGNYYVFSYGYHWILFAYVKGVWYENNNKYSATTSKHHGQAHPLVDTISLNKNDIHKLY
ncbi:hypothetical protein LCGC14_2887200 [marine sediment metagenome]|uniref:Uncharacterized protein n=1 Tax=marine sediment metagenome TaxID=412755 RepID=A0A0F8YK52_9ZZZZ